MFNYYYIMIIWSDNVQWVMTLWYFWCPSLLLQSLSMYFNDFDVSNLGSGQASQVVDSFDELPVDFIRKVSGWIHLGEYKEPLRKVVHQLKKYTDWRNPAPVAVKLDSFITVLSH